MRRLVVNLVVLALVAAACSDDPATETTPTTQPTTTTTFGGTTTTGAAGATTSTTEAPNLKPYGGSVTSALWLAQPANPMVTVDGLDQWRWLAKPLAFGGVWQYDALTGDLAADLVVELPSVGNGGLESNPDGSLTVRYEIDPAAVWSDGVPVTGADFAFTHRAVLEAQDRIDAAAGGEPLAYESCGGNYPRGMLGVDAYRSIDADSISVGEKTFEFTLAEPGAYTFDLFAVVLPKHAVEGSDLVLDWDDRLWPSATAFVLESWDRDAGRAVFVRNENYWRTDPETGQSLPYLDSVIVSTMGEFWERRTPEPYPYDVDGDPSTEPVLVSGVRDLVRQHGVCVHMDPVYAELGFDRDRRNEMTGAIQQVIERTGYDLVEDGLLQAWGGERPPAGLDVDPLQTSSWESVAFHFGEGRLRSNPDSLVEHLEFRRAVAHAIDRDRIAAEAYPNSRGFRIDSILDIFSPTAGGEGFSRYPYDPDEARRLLGELCDRLGRDCVADPPRLTITRSDVFTFRVRIAALLEEMLGDVGIEVDVVGRELGPMLFGCAGWEASTFTWIGGFGFRSFIDMFSVFDPGAGVAPATEGSFNYYAWGTDAVTGVPDDPFVQFGADETPDCDESTVYNQGPSSVRDEFSARFSDLLEQSRSGLPGELLPIVREMDEILTDQVVYIPLMARSDAVLIDDAVLGGYAPARSSGNGSEIHWNVDRWYRKDLG